MVSVTDGSTVWTLYSNVRLRRSEAASIISGFLPTIPNGLFGEIFESLFGNVNGEFYITLYSASPTKFLQGSSVHCGSGMVM
jgi:hypothetical protein